MQACGMEVCGVDRRGCICMSGGVCGMEVCGGCMGGGVHVCGWRCVEVHVCGWRCVAVAWVHGVCGGI